ncbi:MAG: hypothetical protein ACFFD2_14605 [Promethearchaeota archaeon]
MKKKIIILIIFIGVACVCSGFFIKFIFFRYQNTLPSEQDPELSLPMYDFSHNDNIRGYGQVSPEDYHNGIDFGVNDTTSIVAPYAAYIMDIKFWFNERGGHWQTNIRLWLNNKWNIEIAFESWAAYENESYGILQKDAIIVNEDQYVEANQTLGDLLCHGEGSHIHFMIRKENIDYCPYTYFSPSAKSIFAAQFYLVNYTPYWCM